MKVIVRHSISVIFLLAFPMCGNAVTGPKLVCDTPVYNFGQVDQSAVVTNVFMVRNDGNVTFVAGMPRTTCSCTKASISKRMIGPGETAEVTAVFTAVRRAGEQHKTIAVPSSVDPSSPVLILRMEGFVEPSAP